METSAISLNMLAIGSTRALRLENGRLSMDILPELGGKIWNLTSKATGRQWIWHNDKLPVARPRSGSYDDCWLGGWEELFPNDAPGRFEGRDLPDHGEWWSRAWSWDREGAGIKLSLEGRALKAQCEKTISLDPDQARLKIAYRITNLEPVPVHFLFKQHLAATVTPSCRLELPGGIVEPVDLAFSNRIREPGAYPWPMAGGEDLSRLPKPEEKKREFVYVSDLRDGWCGIKDEKTGDRLRLKFDRAVFPFTWLFMDFNGWKGHYVAVLEPCTNKPKDLSEAKRRGHCALLTPGEIFRTEVAAELS